MVGLGQGIATDFAVTGLSYPKISLPP